MGQALNQANSTEQSVEGDESLPSGSGGKKKTSDKIKSFFSKKFNKSDK